MDEGTLTGMPNSSPASFIDEFRSALLKNSTKTLTSEAEALLQHTFGKEWDQTVTSTVPTITSTSTTNQNLNINIPPSNINLNHNQQFNLLSPSKSYPSSICPDIVDSEFDLMVGENTLDWVSNLYNNLPSHELNDDNYDNTNNRIDDIDFLGIGRVSISENNEDDETNNDTNKTKQNQWPMACAECGYIAGNRKQLWRHGKRENHTTRTCPKPSTFVAKPKKEKPDHKCELCEYTSKSRFNVVRHHQRVHVNIKQTMCSICSKQFKDLDTLKTHIRYTHENERRHACDLCDKHFVSSSDLQRHRRIVHEKIRDFVCQKCNKRFQTSTNAKRHYSEVCGKDKNPCQINIITTTQMPYYVQF